MQRFGEELNIINRDNLKAVWRVKMLEKLRKHVYNFMLDRKRENDFFDLDTFNRSYIRDINVTNDIVNQVVLELNELGWKTHIGFGGTGLYVYSSDELPDGVY